MKAPLISVMVLFAANSVFAQGMLIFQNSSATTITNWCNGQPSEGGPGQNDTQVGLYIGNVGDGISSLTLIAATNCSAPGRFFGGIRTLAGWSPGATVQLQVRGWLASTVYSSYEAAIAAALGGDISVMIGASAPFAFTLVGIGTPPNSIASGGLTQFYIGNLTCP